ncbi:hypothetical protein C4N20_15855 [Fusobacterium ulcerans]|uniref:Uncharacterized protein n=2 Tax=Fusobacterium TaxID=848 RepID=A0AAX2JAS5_9FUSO|nr:hypothetical protein [Fusobacterium ulcerans]AVQ29504.1 hypothetical protein C4N20_15855 [Fusobacterium ulcerans]EFS26990.1 hypothetical protein FUAG_02505 [Fusobacterium ulcerans ATCC 49185]SQJ03993.1 Uncharacterised protein [Fusobacterium ulcerans]
MAIIYEKLLNKYTEKELKEKLSVSLVGRLKRGEFAKLETVASRIDISPIDYTYSDFLEDYGEKYKKYKEKKTLFNLLKAGKVMRQLSVENGFLDTTIVNALLRGFTENADSFSVLLPYIGEIEDLKKDLKEFEYTLFKDHIEIYGEKNKLEKFKSDYNINYMVLYHPKKKKDHLAFDGRTFKVIEYIEKNPQK